MGLKKEYLRYGRKTRDHILGWLRLAGPPARSRTESTTSSRITRNAGATPTEGSVGVAAEASGRTSRNSCTATASTPTPRTTSPHERSSSATSRHRSAYSSRSPRTGATPLSMLISQGIQCSNSKYYLLPLDVSLTDDIIHLP